MSFGTMLVHTTNVWEDQPCSAMAEQWDDFGNDYDRFDVGCDFGTDLSLSVDMCSSYQNPELFSMSVLDDYGLPALSCTTLLVETQPDRPQTKKRLREESQSSVGLPSKKPRAELIIESSAPSIEEMEGITSALPSPDTPSAPSSPHEPVSSPSCVSPKALFSPVSDYSQAEDVGFGDLLFDDDTYIPRRRTTRAQSKLLQPITAPSKKERNRLARDIAILQADDLRQVISMVYPHAGEQTGTVDIEFDIADVNDTLFHNLRQFVDSCTKKPKSSTSLSSRKQAPKRAAPLEHSVSSNTSSNLNSSHNSIKSSSSSSPIKSSKPSRKRHRKSKKPKLSVVESLETVAVPRSLTRAEVVIFERQEILTLAQTESAEEDEFVDIGE